MSNYSKVRVFWVQVGLVLAGVLYVLLPGVARAQELPGTETPYEAGFASQGNVVLGVEDLVVAGHAWSAGSEGSGGMGVSGETESAQASETAWGVWNPVRFAADVFILPSLSLGAALRVEHQTYTRTDTVEVSDGGGPTQVDAHRDTHEQTTLRLSPRIGYARWFGKGLGAWIRAGVDVGTQGASDHASGTPGVDLATGPVFGVNLEALAVIQPLPHTIVAIGPTYRRTSIDGSSGDHLVALTANVGVEL